MLLPCRIITRGRYTIVLTCIISLFMLSVFIVPNGKIKGYIWQQPVKSLTPHFVSIEYVNLCLKNANISLAFNQMMIDFDVQAILIEPSVLYCWLSLSEQDFLISKGFDIFAYPASETMTHFALIGKTMETLDQSRFKKGIKKYGFDHVDAPDGNSYVTHHFFKNAGQVIHAVVFQERANYYWSEKLFSIPLLQNIEPGEFKFYQYDTAYERFQTQLLIMGENITLTIPGDMAAFLHQLGSSKFLECDLKRSYYIDNPKKTKSYVELADAFTNSLTVLKSFLQPSLIDFFLWGGTHLGWYRQCGIIPYTSDVDFAAWASDIGEEQFWIDNFYGNRKLKLIMSMGLPNEAYELRLGSYPKFVDLFFVYEDENTTWVSGHVPNKGYYFRYTYPKFDLCSGDLLGHKVLVPCEPLKIIQSDYGSDWEKPVSEWDYKSSPKNMGPPVYWPEEKKFNTFKFFN